LAGPWSFTTQVWPRFISRRTMFPPIRPNPIMPNCMAVSFRPRREREHIVSEWPK
jgi:hypothetical protein